MGHIFLALNHEVSELLASLKQVQEKQNKVRFVFFPAKRGGLPLIGGCNWNHWTYIVKLLVPNLDLFCGGTADLAY